MGGQRDDRYGGAVAAGPDAAGGFETIQFRHLDVHQDEIDLFAVLGQLAQGEGAVVGDTDRGAERLQQLPHNQLIGRHILGHEDAGAAQWRLVSRCRQRFRMIVPALHVGQDFLDACRGHRFLDHFVEYIERAAQVGSLWIVRGHHHQVGALAELGAQHAGQGQAIDAGHVEVDHHAVEAALVGAQAGQGRAARIVGFGRTAVLLKEPGEHAAGEFVVVHDQEAAVRHRLRRLCRLTTGERKLEGEGGAHFRRAVDGDGAAHFLDQALGDDQAEAGAAVLAGYRGVGLGKGLEELRLLFRRHADTGVRDAELQHRLVRAVLQAIDMHGDATLFGELDGIADQVDQHLRQAQRIAPQAVRHVRGHLVFEDQLLFLRLGAQQVGQVVEDFVEIEILLLQLQAAGIDPGKIEDVVDDGQQQLAGAFDTAHVIHVARLERALLQQVRQADHAIERRADLVAHVGQEVGAGLGQCFGRLAGAFPGAAEGTLAVVVEGQAVAQRFQAEQQAADFIVALHVERGCEVAGGNGAKGRQHLVVQRFEHQLAQEQHDDGEDGARHGQAAGHHQPDNVLGEGGEFVHCRAAGDDPLRCVQRFENDQFLVGLLLAGLFVFPVVGHFAALLFQHLVDQLLAAVDPEVEQALAFLVGVQDQFAEVLARRHVDDVVVAAAADLDGPQLRFQRFQLLADVDGDAAGAHDLPLGIEDRGVAAQVLPAKNADRADIGLPGE